MLLTCSFAGVRTDEAAAAGVRTDEAAAASRRPAAPTLPEEGPQLGCSTAEPAGREQHDGGATPWAASPARAAAVLQQLGERLEASEEDWQLLQRSMQAATADARAASAPSASGNLPCELWAAMQALPPDAVLLLCRKLLLPAAGLAVCGTLLRHIVLPACEGLQVAAPQPLLECLLLASAWMVGHQWHPPQRCQYIGDSWSALPCLVAIPCLMERTARCSCPPYLARLQVSDSPSCCKTSCCGRCC